MSLGEDYEKLHRDYTKQIFDSISQYLISLFQTNKLDFYKLYDNMKKKKKKITKLLKILP